MGLTTLVRLYRLSKGDGKVERAWELVRVAARYSTHEPYWKFLREGFNIGEKDVKEAMRLLEERGRIRIKRSVDGRKLYVSTLKDIRAKPVTLDRWLGST
ncbi:hypothetical protein A3L12_06750 [Thermococcus sp. P6]|uniref:hypothetical protein n=1 Tax=Thermococcus sp. P6 TaxID=122420 RepID=UPI000B59E9B1|nr:hypothetical protein [Thermococcus sp. P6]ASJ11022.1 hypothetical protein A3L12_06750 [Thermococcus sp. P6]